MSPIPAPYKLLAGLLLLIAVAFGGYRTGVKVERAEWQSKEIERQQDEKDAILDRIADNERTERENNAKTRRISDDYEKQLSDLRRASAADRAAVGRAGGLRVPRTICDGFAAAAQAAGTVGRNEAAAGTVRLPREVEDGLWRLAEDADAVTEQARACQAWIKTQGFYGEPQ